MINQRSKGPLTQDTAANGVYTNLALTHSITTMLGCLVEAQLVCGETYEGVLRAVSPELEIVLEGTFVKKGTNEGLKKESLVDAAKIKFSDIVTISAKDALADNDIYKVDNSALYGRRLERFTDFEESSDGIVQLDNTKHGWSAEEMWSVNKEKFKVESTFDEELLPYTTQLTREDTEEFKKREERAEILAKEVESGSKNKPTVVEDVGTEEELFSAVHRETSTEPSAESDAEHSRDPGTSQSTAKKEDSAGREEPPAVVVAGSSASEPVEKKEETIRRFKLDPKAKAFTPTFSSNVVQSQLTQRPFVPSETTGHVQVSSPNILSSQPLVRTGMPVLSGTGSPVAMASPKMELPVQAHMIPQVPSPFFTQQPHFATLPQPQVSGFQLGPQGILSTPHQQVVYLPASPVQQSLQGLLPTQGQPFTSLPTGIPNLPTSYYSQQKQ